MATNPIIAAAMRKLGPLAAWQWGAIAGGTVLGARVLLPGVPGGSFLRKNSTPSAATGGTGSSAATAGTVRRSNPTGGTPGGPPVSVPFAAPALSKFLSVTTPGGISIGGDDLEPSALIDILSALNPLTPTVPVTDSRPECFTNLPSHMSPADATATCLSMTTAQWFDFRRSQSVGEG